MLIFLIILLLFLAIVGVPVLHGPYSLLLLLLVIVLVFVALRGDRTV